MEAKHTRNLSVDEGGATLYCAASDKSEYRCIGAAYGWNEDPEYDADRKLLNKLTSNDEALANARLWSAASDLLEAAHRVEVAFNTMSYCYERTPGNFAAALRDAEDDLQALRAAIAKATTGEQA